MSGYEDLISAVSPIDGGRAHALVFELESEEPLKGVLSSAEKLGCGRLILFNPLAVVGPAHAIAAIDYAVAAFRTGKNIARSLHVEAFLFAAATAEISKALEIFRLDLSGKRAIAVVVAERPEDCVKCLLELVKHLNLRVGAPKREESAARLLAQKLGIDEREVKATYSTSFVAAIEKCLLSRMALAFLSR